MKCGYRNCDNQVDWPKRIDAKFCCRNCKDMENTYLRRRKRLIEAYKKCEEEKIAMELFFREIDREWI